MAISETLSLIFLGFYYTIYDNYFMNGLKRGMAFLTCVWDSGNRPVSYCFLLNQISPNKKVIINIDIFIS